MKADKECERDMDQKRREIKINSKKCEEKQREYSER
jgi:hypothetical protein